jgi:hypothetical protein
MRTLFIGCVLLAVLVGMPVMASQIWLEDNPARDGEAAEFVIQLDKEGMTTLYIYDLAGDRVASVLAEVLPAGEHRATWETSRVGSGIYIYLFTAPEWGGMMVQKSAIGVLR